MSGRNQASSPLPMWRVVSQVPSTQQDAQGRFTRGILITAQWDNGVTGEVFVPGTQPDVNQARRIIDAHMREILAIQNLSGQGMAGSGG